MWLMETSEFLKKCGNPVLLLLTEAKITSKQTENNNKTKQKNSWVIRDF